MVQLVRKEEKEKVVEGSGSGCVLELVEEF